VGKFGCSLPLNNTVYGVKKYQGSPQDLETIEKADEAFMQTIRNGEGF
jgi:hypothetical protein